MESSYLLKINFNVFKSFFNKYLIYLFYFFIPDISSAGITGKISGRVIDAKTKTPLFSSNIIVQETTIGSFTDDDGYFAIINIPPGRYNVKCSMIGYKDYIIQDVRVEIDQTTDLLFLMNIEIIFGEQITVEAKKKIIKKDIAATHVSITSKTIEQLPLGSIDDVLGLYTGITNSLGIRGGDPSQTLFMVDGVSLKEERNNLPITALPLSAVKQISAQTGGFNAEYNNVRSGLINVVTKEGNIRKYSGSISIKQSQPSPKHFGISPYNKNSFWLRPYLDPDVCWTGTDNGNWDEYTQRQFPRFDGWNSVSNDFVVDNNLDNDITPSAAQKVYLWEHRKKGFIQKPDQNLDLGFGGPVPLISQYFGNLRFFLSYRYVQNMYLMQLSRDGIYNKSFLIKTTSDISKTTKVSVLLLNNILEATTSSRTGETTFMKNVYDVASEIDRKGFTIPWRIFTNTYWSQTDRNYSMISAKISRLVNPQTFYEIQLQNFKIKYNTGPMRDRDNNLKYEIFPGYIVDEAPFGFEEDPIFGIDGLGMGGSVSTSRDSSIFNTFSLKFNLNSQINRRNNIKSGIKLVYDNFNLKYGMVNKALPEGNFFNISTGHPYRINYYIQDKIEYDGFIPILGLVLDYINPNGKWYNIDNFSRDFFSSNYSNENENSFKNKKSKYHLYISPRLSISHPITTDSKFYFNYGHYRQIPSNENLFRIQRSSINQLDYLGNPNLPLSRTVSYELGYDHSIKDIYLFHLSAYYKNIDDQEDWTQYISNDGKINYQKLTADSYEDIRGFEIYTSKLYGKWVTGQINYEYRVETKGYFGIKKIFENPSDQREYLRLNLYQEKPRPRPRFKSIINLQTPNNFGPKLVNSRPFSDWLFNIVAEWTAGYWFTWNPNNIPGVTYNVKWDDFSDIKLKISKTINYGDINIKFYLDCNNLFNFKYLSGESFSDMDDYNYYFYSLHLPENISSKLAKDGSPYPNIPGKDRPGDFRKQGVEFVPMEWVADIANVTNPHERPIYYSSKNNTYYQWSLEDGWFLVNNQYLDYVLNNKAYIDMPNQTFFSFLNPRDIFLGFTIYYNFE